MAAVASLGLLKLAWSRYLAVIIMLRTYPPYPTRLKRIGDCAEEDLLLP